jgi:hypothetical protein
MSKHKILIDNQHGFRNKLSCETQLIEAIEDWTRAYENKIQTDIVFLDFSKAFDKVPHKRLMIKLYNYGIRGKTARWIKAFISERDQYVSVGGTHSEATRVLSGVPQGTVLGPTLFLLFINDIAKEIQSSIRLFADDSVIYREIKTTQDITILQQDLDLLHE